MNQGTGREVGMAAQRSDESKQGLQRLGGGCGYGADRLQGGWEEHFPMEAGAQGSVCAFVTCHETESIRNLDIV